jgi:hypothetical protein
MAGFKLIVTKQVPEQGVACVELQSLSSVEARPPRRAKPKRWQGVACRV